MFGIGWMEMVVIAGVALVVVGPDKLPEMARGAARFYRGLRLAFIEAQSAVQTEMALLEREMNQAAEPGQTTGSSPEAPQEDQTDERA